MDVRGKSRCIRALRVDRGSHRPAFVVPENHDQGNPEHPDGIFERSDDAVGDDLTRVANDEEVTDSFVENDLGRESTVTAPEQRS